MDASVVETHVSVVFFVGDHVYKLKKPVTFDFVDQSTVAARGALCRREVDLNRRLAPDVYEDVLTVLGSDGSPLDHLVMMKRLPSERRLSNVVTSDGARAAAAIDQVASQLAGFHATAHRDPSIDACATREAVMDLWHANFEQLARFRGSMLDADAVDRAGALSEQAFRAIDTVFGERIADGWICDGHGDLLADDIYVLDDGPRIIDCLEFADRLRFGDVAADLAFLAMDLERLGAHDLAERLILVYERESGATIPRALLHLWIAYRAQVRMMVACLRADQEPDGPSAAAATDQARRLLRICVEHLERAIPQLILVGGLPGSGKSTVAAGLGRAMGATVVRSDVVRKELAGMPPTTSATSSFGTGIYTEEQTERTYLALLDRAAGELARGRSVVLDASFTAARDRLAAQHLAETSGAHLIALRCSVPASEAHRRIQARLEHGEDPSDADTLVAARMAELVDPWPDSIEVSTVCSPDESIARAVAAAAQARRR